jgi:hypothetical protein
MQQLRAFNMKQAYGFQRFISSVAAMFLFPPDVAVVSETALP